ncbi:iron complex transport system permease protein [Sphingomonas sp. BE270]|jgi:iron complex transport system permease protein|uniref:FecCD family ABC transporter permease n=1 Tax=unclassified Sphingomonas TaxID=196159 RepID=UPI000F87E029|nr:MULTISPECIES: iron ABC transporter permease [unclassified Sphingomonas]MDR6847601.1 iron complex transport system permease protein [Sphingomonas sp. BE137]MDR7257633.1 iron complex transport system permease protein [Sphingomonas sp. BE270]RUN75763.1 iron ABC transporter permease [Sphingomonas sp. TF3]
MMLRRIALYAGLLVLLAVLAGLSLIAGRVWVPLSAWNVASSDPRWAIIADLRVPRTILGMLIGAALGLSGAALQGYTRNPLADPGVLGVSAMAALGAVLTLYYGATLASIWVLPGAAMLGALIGVGLLLLLSGSRSSLVTFVLAGAILNIVASAGISLALSLAPSPWAVGEIVDWLMGSLQDRSVDEVRLAAPFILAGAALLLTTGRALDALTLGEAGARSLGISLTRTRWTLALGVGLATGAAVAVSGVIGFVGLVVPHVLRPLVGARPGALLAPSALGGAVLVLAADILVRVTPAAGEVKLGVAMAALGGPFFLALLLTLRRRIA